jgi:hypothetical protein
MESGIFAVEGIEQALSRALEAPPALVFANVRRLSKGLHAASGGVVKGIGVRFGLRSKLRLRLHPGVDTGFQHSLADAWLTSSNSI